MSGRAAVIGTVAGLVIAIAIVVAYSSSADAPEVRSGDPVSSDTSTPVQATATPAAIPVGGATPPASPSAEAASGASITISAVGDISLARELNERMEANGADYPYALIGELLSGDLVIGNLEGALTDRGEPWPKGYNFRTPPKFATGLAAAGFDAVSLANNHAMDYGAIGLTDTIAALDGAGVRWFGGGANEAQVREPLVLEANGLRVAFIGCARSPNEGGGFSIYDWLAGAEPGLAVCETSWLPGAVASARATADFVIVVGHIGDEYVNTPNAMQREIADAALAAGADAYIGHHAHVVQPVELRGSQLIAWGLGNFIFDLDEVDLANIPEPRVAPVLHLTLTKGAGVTAWDVSAVVLDASEDRPRPATEGEAGVLRTLVGG